VLGVDRIISVSAVGSLKENVKPLDMLLVDQFVDRTNQGRKMTFFGNGIVAHIPMAEPICETLRNLVFNANRNIGVEIHNGGTYVNMEGPAFSTKAESFIYKSWGADVIGMTNFPEAKLAREAGICYTTVAMVTDYDCWHESGDVESVSTDMIMENIKKNIENVKKMIQNTVESMSETRECSCGDTLAGSIMTPREAVPAETLEKLKPIIEGFM
jgi:5'-methylthioadenosine phosphorylase